MMIGKRIIRVMYTAVTLAILFLAPYTSTDIAIAGIDEGKVDEMEEDRVAYVDDVPLLDDKQWSELEAIVLSNDSVKTIIQDKKHSLYSQGFVRYLSDDKPKSIESYVWYANIVYIYHEGDSEKYLLSALVDHVEKEVVDLLVVKHKDITEQHGDFATTADPRPGFSIAYYDGNANNIRSFRVKVKAPSSFSPLDETGPLALLLNATAKNSRSALEHLCNPSNTTGSYWAQVGMAWSRDIAVITWSDTRVGCHPQYYQRVTYGNSNTYYFNIYTVSSGSSYTWNICAINATAGQQECIQRVNISQGTFKTLDRHSSIWLENQLTTTDWYTKFGSDIQAGAAKYRKVGDSTLYNWDSASKVDQKCTGEIWPSEVISGNVINGQMAIWDLRKMATNYPAC